MGLCFSVNRGINIPPSLDNIYKELKQDTKVPFSIPEHGDLAKFSARPFVVAEIPLFGGKNNQCFFHRLEFSH